MLKRFLFACCVASLISTAHAQHYQLSAQSSGSGYFDLPAMFGLPEIRGSSPFGLAIELNYSSPTVFQEPGRTSIYATTDVDLTLTAGSGSFHVRQTDGGLSATVYSLPGNAAQR
ncbi:hypothetical protein [Massilia endophytica]|uniref:hypothetical protein n=1 Tax=Massilia endophytica TaxID=2899220 RepID=UPI001E34D1FC|nr:hypothetical protein [Massilia endophytica]UGQ47756.1 hypothetical protein LSQ66_04580 [Massilia endophytica]